MGQLRENAPLMLFTRLEEMYQFEPYITDVNRVAELHNMRIAAKRLRYTMEIFAPSFPGDDYEQIYNWIKNVQERIGEIHDADVRRPLLKAYLDTNSADKPEIRIGLERLIQQQTTLRDKMYNDFVSYWKELQRKELKRKFLTVLADGPPTAVTGAEESA
jgi:CHAD domain-containing protein